MFLKHLEIQQFRCFSQKSFSFSAPITLITGNNGVGKTSVIEAIHYLSYFKSFRSHILSDLGHNGSDSFFLKGDFSLDFDHAIRVGYSNKKRVIRLDQQQITSYKEILPFFQVVTLTEDDIDLIKGYPAERRAFADQAILFENPDLFDMYKEFRTILNHRNAFLIRHLHNFDKLEYEIWSQKLWAISLKIQHHRVLALTRVEKAVNELIKRYFEGIYDIKLHYEPKGLLNYDTFENFMHKNAMLFRQEMVLKRSLFGAHLDDLSIEIRGKKARIFASRGQQKLISLLCKFALLSIGSSKSQTPLLLIDDFLSDFDKDRLGNFIDFFLSCKNQIIITAPFCDSELEKLIAKADPGVISISS